MNQSASKKIVIDLNPNYPKSRHNYISSQEEKLAKLIIDRVQKYESYMQDTPNKDPQKDYEDIKRHDSIHIDGARGVGKTTVISFLAQSKDCKYCKELQEKVYFLPLVDPNQLDKDTNIIDIVTDLIYQEVERFYINNKYLNNQQMLFDKVRDLKCEIDELTYQTYTKNYKDAKTKAKATNHERKLDYTFHLFAEKSCELLQKTVLVLPLDDIDMRLDIGVTILETIRKYFQTPHLIPVIALDSRQAYALVKKDYFEKFHYDAFTPNSDISADSGMDFLKKLPSEYLEKILPPSQRILLYDMLDYYKYERDFIYFTKRLDSGEKIVLSFKEIIRLAMNVLFGYKDETDNYSDHDYHIINYLQNKSFRSFIDDARALMKGLEIVERSNTNKAHRYKLDTSYLKNRFQIQSKSQAFNQYDGAIWFWDRYIESVYREIDRVSKKDEVYKIDFITLDQLKEILIIDAHDTGGLGRKEKIYYRLFLQEFFIKDIFVEFATDSGNPEYNTVSKIEKRYNMTGYIEFLMRTLFPAYLFETLVNKKLISLMKFPLEQLKYFALKNAKRELVNLYDEWVPFWTELYQIGDSETSSQPLAIELSKNDTRLFRKEILYFTTQEDFLEGEQKYYLHPFKMFAFTAEYYPSNSDEFYFKYMPKGYLNTGRGRGRGGLDSLKNSIDTITGKTNGSSQVENTDILDENLMINIIDSVDNIERFAKNILFLTVKKPQEIHDKFYTELNKIYQLDRNTINILYKIESRKNISSSMAILINMLLEIFLKNSKYNDESKNNIKYDITRTNIKSSVNESLIMLPLITDDPFLRNLKLLWQSDISDSKDLIQYIRVLFQIANLDRVYYDDDKSISNLFKKEKIFYPTNIKEAILNIVVKKNETETREAYIKLFCKHLAVMRKKTQCKKLYSEIKKDFGSFSTYMKKFDQLESVQRESYLNMMQELRDRKKRYNDEEKYIERNVTILFIDIIEAMPSFVDELMVHCHQSVENKNAS